MDTIIEIIAPSSAASLEAAEKGRALLGDKGFYTRMPKDILGGSSPYEANTVEYRLKHLEEASNDDDIAAISILRGGYSSTKVAEEIYKLDYFPQKKFIVGFSDATALFAALNGKHDWLCIHGPGVTQLPEKVNPECIDQVLDIINGKVATVSIPGLIPLNYNSPASGKLVGGNLSVLQTTIGTDWEVNCNDKILFLEDCNERGYKIDRMLTHLLQSGVLYGVQAIVLGQFSPPLEAEIININYALSEFARKAPCPVYKTEAFGHGYVNTPLVIGADADIIVSGPDVTLKYYLETLSFHDYAKEANVKDNEQ